MKRHLCICLIGGLLICGSPARPAAAAPPELRNIELLICLGWTEDRRSADPEGFFEAAIARLNREAAECEKARESLADDIERQTREIAAKTELWSKGTAVADKFREAYQRAKRSGCWPVEVCGVDYTEQRLASQVSMLLKEAEALADCVAKMKQVRERSEAKLEELTARVHVVDAQISTCMAKFELWKASRLEAHGEELLAMLDRLIVKRPPLTFDIPYRTEDGLAYIPRDTVDSHPNSDTLVHYLSHQTPRGKRQIESTIGKAGQKKSIFAQY